MTERCPGSEVLVDRDELLDDPDFTIEARALCIACAGPCRLFWDGIQWRKDVHNRPEGCYICRPEDPAAPQDGCSECEARFWDWAVRNA